MKTYRHTQSKNAAMDHVVEMVTEAYFPVVKSCRELVRKSHREDPLRDPDPSEILIGKVFEPDGSFEIKYFQADPEYMAAFLCSSEKEKLVSTRDGSCLCNTISGIFLDLCCFSDRYRNSLLYYLIPVQYGEKDPPKPCYLDPAHLPER